MNTTLLAKLLFILLRLLLLASAGADAGLVGVNYGMKANNLPPPDQVVALYKSQSIPKLRLFDPNAEALAALHGSGIDVVLGTLNQDLPDLANNLSFAVRWVDVNVIPHAQTVCFRYIAAGNEVIPGDLAVYVLPAMRNLAAALTAAGLAIPATTAVSTGVLGASYPPSSGAFSPATSSVMARVAAFLVATRAPLLVNVYPYFAYAGDPQHVPLDYALGASQSVVLRDGSLCYTNLLDAMVDAVYSALEKVGGGGVEIVVAETGWPSGGGGIGAAVGHARTYNSNVVAKVREGKGTPKRPWKRLEAYLFATFNENMKPAGIEQHFGLFYPNMTQLYPIVFG